MHDGPGYFLPVRTGKKITVARQRTEFQYPLLLGMSTVNFLHASGENKKFQLKEHFQLTQLYELFYLIVKGNVKIYFIYLF
jgi:hypothetical protein